MKHRLLPAIALIVYVVCLASCVARPVNQAWQPNLGINPEIQLAVIDADSTVGGVWSKPPVYAGLTCDVPVSTFEFSDLHMNEEFNLPKWSDLPGATMHEYLERL